MSEPTWSEGREGQGQTTQRARVLTLPLMLVLAEALKLERDPGGYAYLNPDTSRVDGMDDDANFKVLQVGTQDGPFGHALTPGSGFEKGGRHWTGLKFNFRLSFLP